ncbi:hypothetical protein ACJX0J_033431, partial [Zea mays]
RIEGIPHYSVLNSDRLQPHQLRCIRSSGVMYLSGGHVLTQHNMSPPLFIGFFFLIHIIVIWILFYIMGVNKEDVVRCFLVNNSLTQILCCALETMYFSLLCPKNVEGVKMVVIYYGVTNKIELKGKQTEINNNNIPHTKEIIKSYKNRENRKTSMFKRYKYRQ